jgi:hypothetical protein
MFRWLTTKRRWNRQDIHAAFASGLRNRGESVEWHLMGDLCHTGNLDIGPRAEEFRRWNTSVESWGWDNEVSDKALALLTAVLPARISVAPALDRGGGSDEGVRPHRRRRVRYRDM